VWDREVRAVYKNSHKAVKHLELPAEPGVKNISKNQPSLDLRMTGSIESRRLIE